MPTAPWTWVCSRQPAPGTGVKYLLPPLRPAWGSVWLGMKCSEARCDCTAKARPPVSWLSHTKTQHSCSAIEETLDCSSKMAKSQMRKQIETAFNKGYFYLNHAAAAAKSLQSCLTLCDPMDCSPPGFSVPGILQERTLEWVAISFSNAWKWKVKVKSLSRVRLLATPWTATYQAPPSMGFSRQQYWSGVPLPSPSWTINIMKTLSKW